MGIMYRFTRGPKRASTMFLDVSHSIIASLMSPTSSSSTSQSPVGSANGTKPPAVSLLDDDEGEGDGEMCLGSVLAPDLKGSCVNIEPTMDNAGQTLSAGAQEEEEEEEWNW